jgi:hypothetical protein
MLQKWEQASKRGSNEEEKNMGSGGLRALLTLVEA